MFYGGAKGGGKSDFLLADFLNGVHWGDKYNGVVFRKTYRELEELEKRAHVLYPNIGGQYLKTDRKWTFPAGSTLKFRYLEAEQDVHGYQGHEYQWIGFDELTSWPTDFCYIFMFSCLRSSYGLPCRMRASGNPGMVGHVWVKNRFIDVGPPGTIYTEILKETRRKVSRVFVPANLDDNPRLKGTQYEDSLANLPDHLYEAFRHGNWDVIVGQVFSEFRREAHIVRPFPLEPEWYRAASCDWGYAKPFSIGWWAVTPEERLIRYREWYGCEKNKPNTGIRMEATQVAEESFALSVAEGCKDIVLDRSMWNKQGTGKSIAKIFDDAGWTVYESISDRVNGLAVVHDRLQTIGYDAQPMMLIFDTCTDWIRTVPVLVADEKKPEDVDTRMEDHPYDETRYFCVSELARRHTRHKPKSRYQGGAFDDEKLTRDYNPLAPEAMKW